MLRHIFRSHIPLSRLARDPLYSLGLRLEAAEQRRLLSLRKHNPHIPPKPLLILTGSNSTLGLVSTMPGIWHA
ncbi:hypothetical protein SAMN05444161_6938 [Rhizobiales bacterium GAS191]|nr:hypothetical protein SAMN05444161_6938 [Rhizobiales bacterium GAS191]